MAAAEDKIALAVPATSVDRRGQGRRVVWLRGTMLSYAADTVFLALFAAAGTASAAAPIAYGAGAAAVCGVVYGATVTNWNLRLSEPNMVFPHSVAAILLQFAVAHIAPQIAFPWLSNLFTVLAFAVVWLSIGASTALWVLCTALGGVFFYANAPTLGVPAATSVEVTLVWLYFSLVLGRCVLLSVYATSMRHRVAESRRKLAMSLEHIQELVSHDELTKAFNRRSLIARLEQERASATRTGLPFSVALLDLDHFKRVNDTHGHAVGDEVLKAFVKTVHATMRDSDVFGRYGGEEFLMILTDSGADAARIAIKRITAAVAGRDWSDVAPGLSLTVSTGISEWRSGEAVEQTLSRADGASYEAKRAGRNCARVA